MNTIHHALDVREFFIGLQGGIGPAADALPGVVDVDVSPAVVAQTLADHGFSGGDDFALINIPCPGIPAIPADGRGKRDGVADFEQEFLLGFTVFVFGT